MAQIPPMTAWELMFSPYDVGTYQAVLEQIRPDDVVLDIGAGDLRLARRMAGVARLVYAVEIAPELLARAQEFTPLPANLIPVCADARTWNFPRGITVGILLMRHCTCFQHYAEKLLSGDAARLITNARWRMGVEVVNLLPSCRLPYADLEMGWYACWCGATGFKPGPPESLTTELINTNFDVYACPDCT